MKLSELRVGGAVDAWEQLGFISHSVVSRSGDVDHLIVVPGLVLRFRDDLTFGPAGLRGWTFADDQPVVSAAGEVTVIDGIPTVRIGSVEEPMPGEHRLGVLGVDHVVVMTGSLDRTCAAIADAIGEPLRRIRDAGNGVRQGFHKVGPIIIEVVERPDLGAQPGASLWGLVFTVSDLDEAVSWLGPDAISAPKDAVQQGRRIATVRNEAGLGVPLALMTPHV
ncbi:MAG: glyoxalase [Actinomycetota bacterium]